MWWTRESLNALANRTQCLVDQYKNYTLDDIGKNVKGQFTLNENHADLDGLKVAYNAYQMYVNDHGAEKKLIGFENYTSEQLFFIAFGSKWCHESTPKQNELLWENDVHSPLNIRLMGALQNSDKFSEVFNCASGAAMNPERMKCKIWVEERNTNSN